LIDKILWSGPRSCASAGFIADKSAVRYKGSARPNTTRDYSSDFSLKGTDLLHQALNLFLHLKENLGDFAGAHQVGIYILLAVIVFCETGLVVWPFLPGDSLLFAVGALAASSSSISVAIVIPLLCVAANCGDLLNYAIGRKLGPAVFASEGSWLLNKKHLMEAHAFYEKHGRKTIVIARFVPIIRTFAPFVAGIGEMTFVRFIGFSIAGGMFWVISVTMAGYVFGNIPWVSKHFEMVVLAIVAISVLPVIIHALKRKGAPQGFDVVVPEKN
jgi:membrane-associated protein